MLTRHSLVVAAALCVIAPALAQDSESVFPTQSGLRATGVYPIRQDRSQWLGANLIGAKVKSASDEPIGRVANLVVNDDGAVEAAVIAIGGLFGLGTKEVAVTYKSLNIVRDKSGDTIDHVILSATKSDLRQAAEFKTLKDQKTERTARLLKGDAATPVKFTPPSDR